MLNIRPAKLSDLSNIATLHAQSWRENYYPVLAEEYLASNIFAEREAVWQAGLSSPKPNQLVLVAEIDGDFCGFICAFGENHPKFGTIIDNLHVKAGSKGQGTGSHLLAATARWADKNYQQHDLYLEVLECNPKAMGFYQAKGAKHIASAIWQTPCNNQAVEFIYSWGSAINLLKAIELPVGSD